MKVPSILKNKNYMLLFNGLFVSSLGDAVFRLGIVWYIMSIVDKNVTGFYISLYLFASLLPFVFIGPISGVLADKLDRKKIIYLADFVRGLSMFILFGLYQIDLMNIVALVIVGFINGCISSMFSAAIYASIPNIVEEKDLVTANSMKMMTRNISTIIGGLISGFLFYYFGVIAILIINGISFILSGLSEMFINIPKTNPTKLDEGITVRTIYIDLKAVFKYILNNKALRFIILIAVLSNFASVPVLEILIPKTIKLTMGLTSREFGVLQSVLTVGSLVMLFFIPVILKRIKMSICLAGSLVFEGLTAILYGGILLLYIAYDLNITVVFGIYLAITAVLGMINAIMNIPLMTTFQKKVPDEYRGRFFSIVEASFTASIPLGTMFFGVLSDHIDITYVYGISGLIVILCGIIFHKNKVIKEIDD